jgi:ADP-heptose:LPS heptosyltransferase
MSKTENQTYNMKENKSKEIINKDEKYLIFHSEGGHGKQIMASSVIRAMKKQYPDRKLIWITPWDGPAFYNPNIYRFYSFNELKYFYDDYINMKDVKIFRQEPYHTEDHILQKKHLTKSWCDMYSIPYDGPQPELYLNPREIEIAKDKIKPHLGKPIMLLQTHGGGQGQYSKKSWARDIPIEIAQKLVNYYSKNYRILHMRRPDQPELQGVELLNLPLRELYAVFQLSSKRLFMDSFSQHVAAALNLPSTVCWIANKPEVFGYEIHDNILPHAHLQQKFNKYSYLDKFDISGQVQQFPYDTVNVFDINKIIESLDKQPAKLT